jgi:hypothetical protein
LSTLKNVEEAAVVGVELDEVIAVCSSSSTDNKLFIIHVSFFTFLSGYFFKKHTGKS